MSEPVELDARRLLCPMPVIRTQERIKTMHAGERLRVVCTDPGVLQDIPAWCRVHGHRVVAAGEENDLYLVEIEVVNAPQ